MSVDHYFKDVVRSLLDAGEITNVDVVAETEAETRDGWVYNRYTGEIRLSITLKVSTPIMPEFGGGVK